MWSPWPKKSIKDISLSVWWEYLSWQNGLFRTKKWISSIRWWRNETIPAICIWSIMVQRQPGSTGAENVAVYITVIMVLESGSIRLWEEYVLMRLNRDTAISMSILRYRMVWLGQKRRKNRPTALLLSIGNWKVTNWTFSWRFRREQLPQFAFLTMRFHARWERKRWISRRKQWW